MKLPVLGLIRGLGDRPVQAHYTDTLHSCWNLFFFFLIWDLGICLSANDSPSISSLTDQLSGQRQTFLDSL